MRIGVIYKVVSPSGKCYIGQTIKKLEIRKSRHSSNALNGYNNKFSNAIRKYGNRLKWEVLYNNIPEKYLNGMEITVISWYNSYMNGYNSTIGGEGSGGYKCSEETKKKLSLASKGRKISEEHKKKLSQSMRGRKLSNGHKKKLSKAKFGVSRPDLSGDKHPRAKLDWDNVKEIRIKYASGKYTYPALAKEYGVSKHNIRKIVKHKSWVTLSPE